jgi:hypothetical protein
MKTYDVTCPVCGCVNHNLYLEETNGWMECEKCLCVTKRYSQKDWIRLPVYKLRGNTGQVAAPRAQ